MRRLNRFARGKLDDAHQRRHGHYGADGHPHAPLADGRFAGQSLGRRGSHRHLSVQRGRGHRAG